MPNNCSTLIQRKQNIIHKILRSKSERKSLNAITESTSNLRLASSRKNSVQSPSPNHLPSDSPGTPANRRSNLFNTNRVQPTTDHIYEKHLPSIGDTPGGFNQQHRLYDDLHSRSRSKNSLTNASPKSARRSLSASISSIFNTLSKRSTENIMGSNGEINELKITSSRRPRPVSNDSSKYGLETNQTTIKQLVTPQKHSADNGMDTRNPINRPDTHRQQRASTLSGRLRYNVPNIQVESPLVHEILTKEQTNGGQLYQRRTNNSVRSPIKQKIDKYRRRSEEITQAVQGNLLTNTGNVVLSTTTLTLATPPSVRSKPPASTSPVRRVTSDAEIQARLEVVRLSIDSNLVQTDQHPQQNSQHRVKSAHIHSTHQQIAPSTTTPHTASVPNRRSQPISSAAPVQYRQNNTVKLRQQRQSSAKQSTIASQGNLYLAFIASRHLSTLEDTLRECDIDHPKLLRIFTWLKNVEDHRHEQSDHDLLIAEQNQRMAEQEENFSLYSEIQHAVDDLPANTNGEPCERIAMMEFEE